MTAAAVNEAVMGQSMLPLARWATRAAALVRAITAREVPIASGSARRLSAVPAKAPVAAAAEKTRAGRQRTCPARWCATAAIAAVAPTMISDAAYACVVVAATALALGTLARFARWDGWRR